MMLLVPAYAGTSGGAGVGSAPARRRPNRRERRLARGLHARAPDALRELYDEFGGVTFSFLLRALGDRGAAEDVQQNVFAEVWRRAEEYDPERASPLTWILTIARSRATDHLRRRTPEPRDPTDAAAIADVAAEDQTDRLLGDARLAWLLRRLPSEEAEVLRLRFREDRTQTEIAEQLGLPLGTVKHRMVQALDRLRVTLEAEEGVA